MSKVFRIKKEFIGIPADATVEISSDDLTQYISNIGRRSDGTKTHTGCWAFGIQTLFDLLPEYFEEIIEKKKPSKASKAETLKAINECIVHWTEHVYLRHLQGKTPEKTTGTQCALCQLFHSSGFATNCGACPLGKNIIRCHGTMRDNAYGRYKQNPSAQTAWEMIILLENCKDELEKESI